MLSTRRKYKPVGSEHEVEDLKAQFESSQCDNVRDNGKHVLLKFLVRCGATKTCSQPVGSVLDDIDRLNATGELPSEEQVRVLHERCSGWLRKLKVPAPYLEYLAHYFHNTRVRHRFRQNGFKRYDGVFVATDTWLSWDTVRRSLVVPDIRKLALELYWTMSVRPGEREFVKRLTNNTTSTVYGALQALRPAEYLGAVRTLMLYGTLEDMHNEGMLCAAVLAIIQTRMNNRSGMDWIKRCVRFSHSLEVARDTVVPLLVVEQTGYLVSFRDGTVACKDVTTAFAYWCQHAPDIIDGRYDVSECTI